MHNKLQINGTVNLGDITKDDFRKRFDEFLLESGCKFRGDVNNIPFNTQYNDDDESCKLLKIGLYNGRILMVRPDMIDDIMKFIKEHSDLLSIPKVYTDAFYNRFYKKLLFGVIRESIFNLIQDTKISLCTDEVIETVNTMRYEILIAFYTHRRASLPAVRYANTKINEDNFLYIKLGDRIYSEEEYLKG